MVKPTPYMAQTPGMSLDDIAQVLWQHSEYEAYRALMAYIKERDAMLVELKEQA